MLKGIIYPSPPLLKPYFVNSIFYCTVELKKNRNLFVAYGGPIPFIIYSLFLNSIIDILADFNSGFFIQTMMLQGVSINMGIERQLESRR